MECYLGLSRRSSSPSSLSPSESVLGSWRAVPLDPRGPSVAYGPPSEEPWKVVKGEMGVSGNRNCVHLGRRAGVQVGGAIALPL